MKDNSGKNLHCGFSLIEVILVLLILLIMIGLSSPSVLSLTPKYKLKKAAWEIQSLLNFTRYKAIFEGEKARISFSSSCCTIELYDSDKDVWKIKLESPLEGVAVSANNSPLFHPGGTVSNLASIYVINSSGQVKITIAITGRIKAVLL